MDRMQIVAKVVVASVLIAVGAFVAVILGLPSLGKATEPHPRQASALADLPAASSLPGDVQKWAHAVSARVGLTPTNAMGRTRLLRSGLGGRKADAYAFANEVGGYCVLLVGDAGTCSDRDHLAKSGIQWMVGGGIPGAPGNLFALVTDDVVGVELVVDGRAYPASIANNIAFAEFPADASEALIRLTYAAGNRHESRVQLQGNGLPLSKIPSL
jgi:hypothetical protein